MMNKNRLATLAGGCFWCLVPPFMNQAGVLDVVAGYIGGRVPDPTYEQVCMGDTGHYEAVQITFDPMLVTYQELLDIFWRQIDPTDAGGQFFDRGSSYRTAIFFHDEEQHQLAETSRWQIQQSGRFNSPIATAILPAGPFYPAEEYHQAYHKKNPQHYKRYRLGSGRDAFLNRHWSQAGKNPNR